jgi:hypothetical protein
LKKSRVLIVFLAIVFVVTISINIHTSHLDAYGNIHLSNLSEDYQLFLPEIEKQLHGYFVSPDGNDANPGTFALPWRTIGKAARMVQPGDTVYIRGGIYNEATLFTTSGTATSPIRILAYPGENPIIEGNNSIPGTGGGLISIRGDYIYASGLEVRNSAYDGIQVLGSYDVVGNMFVHGSQKKGIFVSRGHNSIVEYNRIWRNSIANEYGQSDTWSSGITVGRDGVSHATVRHNSVWENWGQGINTYESDYTVIEDNIVHDSYSTNIYIHDVTNVLCQRNFIYMNPESAVFGYGSNIGIMMGDERNFPSSNITIINNISLGNQYNYALFSGTNIIDNILIANNTFVNGIIYGGVLLRGYHQNVRFENNIVLQDGDLPAILITLDPDVSFSNNLWSKPPVAAANGPGDVIADPLLAKTGELYMAEWFRLTALSPAINRAKSIPEVFEDYFGKPRAGEPDIGAIEFFP